MMADLIAAGLQSGWTIFNRAVVPATCGHDIDVPDIMLYFTRRSSAISFVGEAASLQAAKMFRPGAVISGCNKQYHLLLFCF